MEQEIAPHSTTFAWTIPWMEELGRLQSVGSLRVGHDWVTSLSLFPFMHWRRKWQSTPVFLPGESQGRGSLVGCRLWGHTVSDTTEVTQQQQQQTLLTELLMALQQKFLSLSGALGESIWHLQSGKNQKECSENSFISQWANNLKGVSVLLE